MSLQLVHQLFGQFPTHALGLKLFLFRISLQNLEISLSSSQFTLQFFDDTLLLSEYFISVTDVNIAVV